MARTEPFDRYLDEYERWFEENRFVYESEIEAVRHFIPAGEQGVEIGIGSGRFAVPLGIKVGVDPSGTMREHAAGLGLQVYDGTAEQLPLEDGSFDFALMVTTICFVDDVGKAFREARRVLRSGGHFVIGLVDKDSPLGKLYLKMKDENKFYRHATFYSTEEVRDLLSENYPGDIEIVRSVFGELSEIRAAQTFKEGYGEGGFVVINAAKV